MSDASSPQSERVTCAGCRQQGRALDLERFVHHDTVGLVHDMRRGAPGREVFAHPHPECLSAAAWGGFARELGLESSDLDADELLDDVRSGVDTRLLERLGDAARHDVLLAGDDAVRRSMASEDVELVIVASDRAVDAWEARGRDTDVPVFAPLDSAALGEVVGADALAVVGVRPGERAEAIGRDLEKIVCLEFDAT